MAIAKRMALARRSPVFEYAPAPEAVDHVRIAPRYDLFIGGRFARAHSRRRFETVNPATEEVLSEIAEADEVDVDRAVAAAAEAFRSWSRLPAAHRARDVFRLSRLIQERARELAATASPGRRQAIRAA